MAETDADQHTIYQRPAELLQNLIRFDTTNPPGNEAECIAYIGRLLSDAGFETTVVAKDPNRPNLIARLLGRGSSPPFLLYGHVDVVSTAHQDWSHPPFSGVAHGGYVWGRGALDMKGGVAMMLAAFLRAKAEGITPAGDVILAILSDEEAGGNYGAMYLVEEHGQLFKGVRYAIGEFGGFPLHLAGKKFYAIQVAEKQICWLKATTRGPGGHGSLPIRGGAMAKLADMLHNLDRSRLPVHITPLVREMLETLIKAVPEAPQAVLSQLCDPATTDQVLDALGEMGLMFNPLFHNTANATIVHGGEKINVIPSRIEVELDCRLLPGYGPDEAMAELRAILGSEVELELVRHEPGPPEPDLSWFDTLADILRESDADAIPIPLLLTGSSDARFFSRLGIQTYGFTPMNLPDDLGFLRIVHGADERVPIESIAFGTDAIFKAIQRYQ
jgi:acetylornithine deacetylase/succinyl-diaminopimelate desuccinylase-like protein